MRTNDCAVCSRALRGPESRSSPVRQFCAATATGHARVMASRSAHLEPQENELLPAELVINVPLLDGDAVQMLNVAL